ncbi:hypothetical protein [Streptomyces sp900116325]|uniref:hypothetical protein n=1 Tax=Streptomyces sp. 900116325 TaxID=3154295 RepID=UPI003331DD7C
MGKDRERVTERDDRVDEHPVARGDDPETFTELVRGALHGLATLTEGHRLRPGAHRARVDLLIDIAVAST